MDIRKLQRAIVDGLEDVKAQHIVVFNTEHLSPLFERVIIASGTSNRQTKALASSVRDAVKSAGFPILSTEGSDNGEWIIVDCGAAVAHIMQPGIREYYRLEEIWGGKSVKMKIGDDTPRALPKASVPAAAPTAKTAASKRAGAARKAAPAKPAAPPRKAAPARPQVPARTAAPAKPTVPARKAAPAKPTTPASRRASGKSAPPARKAGSTRKASPTQPSAPARRSVAAPPAATSRRSAAAKRPAGTGGNRKRG